MGEPPEQSNAMQSNAKQCNAKQCKAKQSNAKQCNAKQCKAKQNNAKQCTASAYDYSAACIGAYVCTCVPILMLVNVLSLMLGLSYPGCAVTLFPMQ